MTPAQLTTQPDNPTAPRALFELRGLYKAFNGVPVIEGIDLPIERGKTTVILGPSGCGKTVLLKHLIGLLRPDRGDVFFDGACITHLNERQLIDVRRRCGYLFQAGALFDSETVGANIAFPLWQHTTLKAREIRSIVLEKLDMVGFGPHREPDARRTLRRPTEARRPGPRHRPGPRGRALRRTHDRPGPHSRRHHQQPHPETPTRAAYHQRRRHPRHGQRLQDRRPHDHARPRPHRRRRRRRPDSPRSNDPAVQRFIAGQSDETKNQTREDRNP